MIHYLIGVVVSMVVWVWLTRWRLKGGGIKMPGDIGYLFEPISDHYIKTYGYNGLMAGGLVMSVMWPIVVAIIIFFVTVAWIIVRLKMLWDWAFGDGKFSERLFGVKK